MSLQIFVLLMAFLFISVVYIYGVCFHVGLYVDVSGFIFVRSLQRAQLYSELKFREWTMKIQQQEMELFTCKHKERVSADKTSIVQRPICN